MRTIRVTGKGQIKVKPDMTRITMTLDGLFKDYDETLRHSSEDTEALKDILSGFGFERADLKTLNFSVDTEYESCRDRDGSYKQRFSGYRFRHMLKVEFPSDKQTDKKAKPEKDTEIIPWKDDEQEYMAKNVLPFQPKAKIVEKQTKVGYEIPFTREFYKYVAPRKSEEIYASLQELDRQEQELMAKIIGK